MKQEILKQERKARKLSVREMSGILNISHTAYNRKEQGLSEFTLSEAYALSKFFGKSIKNLFLFKE